MSWNTLYIVNQEHSTMAFKWDFKKNDYSTRSMTGKQGFDSCQSHKIFYPVFSANRLCSPNSFLSAMNDKIFNRSLMAERYIWTSALILLFVFTGWVLKYMNIFTLYLPLIYLIFISRIYVCEDGRWMELTEDRVQWWVLVLAVLNCCVLLPDS